MRIGVVDYGVGNIANVIACLEYVATTQKIVRVHSGEEIQACDKIILPGVGAFGSAMEHLRSRGLVEVLREYAASNRYMLGICLGAQLLFEKSYEFGEYEGLGLLSGEVVRFGSQQSLEWSAATWGNPIEQDNQATQKAEHPSSKIKIPHIGWNKNFIYQPHPLCANLHETSCAPNLAPHQSGFKVYESCYLYFVHSYHICCPKSSIIATCRHGVSFPSIVGSGNILGMQPHPERSHEMGFRIMKQFMNLS